jgi:hypothetical protein
MMKGKIKGYFDNISKNAVNSANSIVDLSENYRDAMEFIMEKGLYPEFLQFQVSKEESKE